MRIRLKNTIDAWFEARSRDNAALEDPGNETAYAARQRTFDALSETFSDGDVATAVEIVRAIRDIGQNDAPGDRASGWLFPNGHDLESEGAATMWLARKSFGRIVYG